MHIHNSQFTIHNSQLIPSFFILFLITACTLLPARRPATSLPRSSTFVTVTPTTETPSPTVTPPPPPEDLSHHQAAMLPEFATDIEDAIARGVTRYAIEARLLPESLAAPNAPTLQAGLHVYYTNTETVLLNQVYFRLFPNTPGYGGSMTVQEVLVNGQPVGFTLSSENSALFVPLSRALEPGQSVEISLAYQATVPITTGPGSGLFAYDQDILSLAGFYPTIPVFDYQGWHLEVAPTFADAVYTDVALYDISMTVPQEMVVVTSGNIVNTVTHNDGTKTIQALSGPMREFYIVMSSQFQSLSRKVGQTTVTSYFPVGQEAAGGLALDVGANALETFSSLFGPYPYQEFDLAAVPVPDWLGGLEYPGVAAMAARYYSGSDNTFMEFVTVHEVAHQWWYGLIGSDPVSHPWLDESLTQYSVLHYYERRYGPERRPELIAEMFSPFRWQLQDTGADRPVFGHAATFDEALYYPVVYGKGPLFFEAVRERLGDTAYLAALRDYGTRFRYGIARPEDLLAIFEQAGGQSVEDLFQQWIR